MSIKLFNEYCVRSGVAMLLVMSLVYNVHAQGRRGAIEGFLSQVQQAYKNAAYLDFQVKYLYTNAGSREAMDSLSGEVQMDKDRCRMRLAGTETVTTGRYVIQVMPEDKAIYLSGARMSSPSNPIQLLDSMLVGMKEVKGEVREEGACKVMTLQFPSGNIYDRITIRIDAATGFFQQVNYHVRTEGLVGHDLVAQAGREAPYQPEGEVTMLFSHYSKGRFGDAIFDEKNFFTRVDGKIEPSGEYKDYHIFLASSNL